MASKVVLSYATQSDVEEYYGKPSLYSCRAVIARIDGEPVGLGGVYRVNATMVVFTDIKEAMLPYKKDIIRASRMVLAIIARYTTVVSYPDPAIKTADTFGNHFGFMDTGLKNENRVMMARVNR
jgi:hypothetical protein